MSSLGSGDKGGLYYDLYRLRKASIASINSKISRLLNADAITCSERRATSRYSKPNLRSISGTSSPRNIIRTNSPAAPSLDRTALTNDAVLLPALVNLDPYTFTDDLAEEIVGENENEQRTTEEVLLSAIDGLEDSNLTGFALRLALIGHMDTPREGEFDFLAEAQAAFAPPQPKNAASKKPR